MSDQLDYDFKDFRPWLEGGICKTHQFGKLVLNINFDLLRLVDQTIDDEIQGTSVHYLMGYHPVVFLGNAARLVQEYGLAAVQKKPFQAKICSRVYQDAEGNQATYYWTVITMAYQKEPEGELYICSGGLERAEKFKSFGFFARYSGDAVIALRVDQKARS